MGFGSQFLDIFISRGTPTEHLGKFLRQGETQIQFIKVELSLGTSGVTLTLFQLSTGQQDLFWERRVPQNAECRS